MLDFMVRNEKILLSGNLIPWDTLKENIPRSNGVYAVFDKDQNMLYVGSSKNLYDRLYNHHRTHNNSDLFLRLSEFDSEQTLESCYVKFVLLDYGRAEFEEYMIEKYNPALNYFKRKKVKNVL